MISFICHECNQGNHDQCAGTSASGGVCDCG